MPFLFKKAARKQSRVSLLYGFLDKIHMSSSLADHENKFSRFRSLDATGDACNTRFLEFLAGVLSKGVWWMPRLKKAMKDAA